MEQDSEPRNREEFLRERIRKLNRLGIMLTQERDLDRLLWAVVEEGRRFYNCDAGSLYIREGDRLQFRVAQNDTMRRRQGSGNAGVMRKPIPISRRSIAGYVAATGEILNLEDVYDLPPGTEYEADHSFDEANRYRTRSMLAIPLKDVNERVIGVLQLINPLDAEGRPVTFNRDAVELARSLASQATIALTNAQLVEAMRKVHLDTIFRLALAAEYKDVDTSAHIQRISHYCAALAEGLNRSRDYVEQIRLASPMHDIGKIGIPDAILLKPGRLTPSEFEQMKQHTIIGARLLAKSDSPLIQMSERIAVSHHEKWDGSGYPHGLAGEEIPLEGRIVAVADVFDALTSKRCYKPAFALEKALEIMRQGRERHFDPDVLETFFVELDRILEIREAFQE